MLSHVPGSEITLKTIGGLPGLKVPTARDDSDRSFSLVGETTEGVQLTLLDCFLYTWARTGRGLASQEIRVGRTVFGVHDASAARALRSMTVWMDQLTPWVWEVPFREEFDDEHTLTARHVPPRSRRWEVAPLSAEIELWGGLSSGGGSFFEFNSRLDFALTITPRSPQPYAWFHDAAWKVRNLLCLLTGEPAFFTRVIGHYDGQSDLERSDVIFPQRSFKRRDEVHYQRQFAPLREIEGMMGTVLETWFSNVRSLSVVIDLYFDELLDLDVYSMSAMFGLTQIAEGVHRLRNTPSAADQSLHAGIRKQLNSAIPPDLPAELDEKLRSRIGSIGEPSLPDRVRDLLSSLDGEFCDRFFPDRERFVRDVAAFRNYFAHLPPNRDNPLIDERRAVMMIERMRVLIAALLLREAGLTERQCNNGFMRRFGWITRVGTSAAEEHA